MDNIRKKIQIVYNDERFPFILLFACMLVLHIAMKEITGDDLAFARVLDNRKLGEFLIERYNTWTSRLVIEGIMVIILQANIILWKLIDTLMYVLLGCSISYLFIEDNKRELNFLIIMLILIYPIRDMETAGWVATTMNYLWPLSLGMASIIPVKKVIKQVKIRNYEYILYILSTIYASNSEQTLIWLIPTFISAIAFNYIYRKKISKFLLLELFICLVNLAISLICPGNHNRLFLETQTWMPDFGTFTFIEKVYLGFSETMVYFTTNCIGLFIIFTIILFLIINSKHNNMFFRFISLIPLLIVVIGNSLSFMFPYLAILFKKFFIEYSIDVQSYNILIEYIPAYTYILLVGCIVISIYLIFENNFVTLLCLFILTLGLTTRMAMGFSPTLFASSTRTYLYLYFAFIITIIILMSRTKLVLPKEINLLLYRSITLMTMLSFFNNFIVCYMLGR